MDAEVRAQLVEVADRAVEDYDSGAEPYRSVGEAVIDAVLSLPAKGGLEMSERRVIVRRFEPKPGRIGEFEWYCEACEQTSLPQTQKSMTLSLASGHVRFHGRDADLSVADLSLPPQKETA